MTHIHGLVDSAAGNREVDPDLLYVEDAEFQSWSGITNSKLNSVYSTVESHSAEWNLSGSIAGTYIPLSGSSNIHGSLIPSITTATLGSLTYPWKDVYISSGSLYLGSKKVLSENSNGNLQIGTSGTNFVGITIANPTEKLHVYGASVTSDSGDIIHNGIFCDTVTSGDTGIWFGRNGKQSWNYYTYRGEADEFTYLWNQNLNKDVMVTSDSGRVGFNKQSNIINYHNLWENPAYGNLVDLVFSGTYTKTYQLMYRIAISEMILPNANSFYNSNKWMLGGANWSLGSAQWSLSNGTLLHATGNTTTSSLVASTRLDTLTAGSSYKVQFKVTGCTNGTVTPGFGTGVTGTAVSTNGTFEQIFTADTGGNANSNNNLRFTPTSLFDGAISNVSLILVSNGNDNFRWQTSLDSVTFTAYSSHIECSTSPILLSNGISIAFGVSTGHNGSDNYRKWAFCQSPLASFTVNPIGYDEVATTVDYTQGTPVYRDMTFSANSRAVLDTISIFPISSTNGVIYFGSTVKINLVYITLATAGVGVTLIAEYWNGSTWVILTSVSHDYLDSTVNLTVSGKIRWEKTLMTGWAKCQLPGTVPENGYNLYWIRLRSTSAPSTSPILFSLIPHGESRFQVYASPMDGFPTFNVDAQGRVILGGQGQTYENNKLHLITSYGYTSESADGNSVVSFDSDTINARDLVLKHFYTSNTNSPAIVIAKARGSISVPTGVAQNDLIGDFKFKVRIGSVWREAGGMKSIYIGNGSTTRTTKLQFCTVYEGLNSSNSVARVEVNAGADGIGTLQFFSDTVSNGVAINEFSSDKSLSGNSDLAVPTEKAVKTYVDLSQHTQDLAITGKVATSTLTTSQHTQDLAITGKLIYSDFNTYSGLVNVAQHVQDLALTGKVSLVGNQTIGGTKTFSSPISGSMTGNAGTSTTLATPRLIDGVSFNGSADIKTNTENWHGILARPVGATNPLPTSITSTTFPLSAAAHPITYYFNGTAVTVSSDKTTVLSPGTAGLYYIFFDGTTGNLSNGAFPGLTDTSNVLVAAVFWNGTDHGLVIDERHGFARNLPWHLWAHTTVGVRYRSGLTVTATGTGATATFASTGGEIDDEDIAFSIDASSAFPTANTCRLLWQTGATTYTYDKTPSTVPFKRGGNNRPVCIRSTDYAIVEMPSAQNRYVNVFVYAATDLHIPIYMFVETTDAATISAGGYTSLALARAVAFPNLSNFGLSPELRPIYRLIIRADGVVQAITAADDYRTVTSLPQAAGNTATIASSVTFTPYGNVSSSNVQLAIQDLDDIKMMRSDFDTYSGSIHIAQHTQDLAITGKMTAVAPSTSGNVLTSNGSAWISATQSTGTGASRWTETTGFTATPASTSTLTFGTDRTSILKVGIPVRYTIATVIYYGIVTACTSVLLTIAGAPMGGDVTKLEYGTPEMVVQISIPITGTYGDATDTDLLYNDMGIKMLWRLGIAYCVKFSGTEKVVDTGAEPKVNVLVNAQRVSINDSNLGIQLTNAGEWVDNVAVAINTTYYDINNGEALTIECTAKGGSGDAAHLTVEAVFVLA